MGTHTHIVLLCHFVGMEYALVARYSLGVLNFVIIFNDCLNHKTTILNVEEEDVQNEEQLLQTIFADYFCHCCLKIVKYLWRRLLFVLIYFRYNNSLLLLVIVLMFYSIMIHECFIYITW